VPGSPDDELVNVLAASAPVADLPLKSAVVTSVLASAPAGLPGAAIVIVLSRQSMTSKVMFSTPPVA